MTDQDDQTEGSDPDDLDELDDVEPTDTVDPRINDPNTSPRLRAKLLAIQRRHELTETIAGGAVRLAPPLGKGQGWTLSVIGKSWCPKWYLGTREKAIEAVDRYLNYVSGYKQL